MTGAFERCPQSAQRRRAAFFARLTVRFARLITRFTPRISRSTALIFFFTCRRAFAFATAFFTDFFARVTLALRVAFLTAFFTDFLA